jgi:hypothetical protein
LVDYLDLLIDEPHRARAVLEFVVQLPAAEEWTDPLLCRLDGGVMLLHGHHQLFVFQAYGEVFGLVIKARRVVEVETLPHLQPIRQRDDMRIVHDLSSY